jgi:hypothetical protein
MVVRKEGTLEYILVRVLVLGFSQKIFKLIMAEYPCDGGMIFHTFFIKSIDKFLLLYQDETATLGLLYPPGQHAKY